MAALSDLVPARPLMLDPGLLRTVGCPQPSPSRKQGPLLPRSMRRELPGGELLSALGLLPPRHRYRMWLPTVGAHLSHFPTLPNSLVAFRHELLYHDVGHDNILCHAIIFVSKLFPASVQLLIW